MRRTDARSRVFVTTTITLAAVTVASTAAAVTAAAGSAHPLRTFFTARRFRNAVELVHAISDPVVNRTESLAASLAQQ